VLLPAALETSMACPLRVAKTGRANLFSAPRPGEPPAVTVASPVPETRGSQNEESARLRTGAKRGPKPLRGRLIVLPVQFHQDRQTSLRMPEGRLMLAILADAIECFQKYKESKKPRQRALFIDARRWLMARKSDDWSRREAASDLSFEYVCDVLDLDPDAIRSNLERWQGRQATVQIDG